MATSNQALVRDNSTDANFRQWASAISAFFTTAGWVQSGDSGQVANWTTQVRPSVGNYVYEIWQPNDGLTNFYLKVEYGLTSASTNTGVALRLSIGTSTNGAGTLTGFVTALQVYPVTAPNISSTVTQWQCYFSGDSGRIGIMLWRDDTANAGPVCFVVQRSLNSSGVPTSDYVTLAGVGNGNSCVGQQTIVFGVGVGTAITPATGGSNGLICLKNANVQSALFNGNISISPVFPDIGYFANPMDMLAVGSINDFSEGSQYTIAAGNMPYGVSHNYIASKNPPFYKAFYGTVNVYAALLMRYD